MEIILISVAISYLFGVYFSVQGLRSPVERPLVYRGETLIFVLLFFTSIVPLLFALYNSYLIWGIWGSVLIAITRFAVLPIFNPSIMSLMKRLGI